MSQSELFEELIINNAFFAKCGYAFKSKDIFNPDTENEWCKILFYNAEVRKEIAFCFYPSYGSIVRNTIDVYITNALGSNISLSSLLAFYEKNGLITTEDTAKFVFTFNPSDIRNSIKGELQKIQNVLQNQAKSIFLSEAWIRIPIEDARDLY
jgi:hypothetical protein